MVNALIQISPETNQTLNIIKAQRRLRDKGQAVDWLANEYASCPECAGRHLKPEAIKRIREAEKGSFIRYGSLDAFNKHFDAIRTQAQRKIRQKNRKTREKSAKTSKQSAK